MMSFRNAVVWTLPSVVLMSGACMAQSDPGILSARSHALGGIGAALQEIESVYANPAGLAGIRGTAVHMGSSQSFGLGPLTQVSAGIARQIGRHHAVFARAGQFGFEAFNERLISAGYAMRFADRISGAARFDLYQISIENYGSAMVPGFLIGVQFRLGSTVTLGTTVRNPVRIATHDALEMPSVLTLGLAYQPSDAVAVFAEVEKDIDFPPRMRLAVEYQVAEPLVLRAGAAGNPGTFHAGFGLRVRPALRIDIAASYHTYLGVTPAVSIIYLSTP